MESRFVLTAKPLEPQDVADAKQGQLLDWDTDEPCKAKARHVMKGFSEDGAEQLEAATPQGTREGALLVTQMIVSNGWQLGFLDFTQAFHSGDPIQRTVLSEQPREGIPGLQKGPLIRLLGWSVGMAQTFAPSPRGETELQAIPRRSVYILQAQREDQITEWNHRSRNR